MCNNIRKFSGMAIEYCPNCLDEIQIHCATCIHFETSDTLNEVGTCYEPYVPRGTQEFFADCAGWVCCNCRNGHDRLDEGDYE